MKQTTERDTIIDEIHQTRRQIADKFDGDITAMLDDARQRQSMSGRKEWRADRTAEVHESEPAAPTVNDDETAN